MSIIASFNRLMTTALNAATDGVEGVGNTFSMFRDVTHVGRNYTNVMATTSDKLSDTRVSHAVKQAEVIMRREQMEWERDLMALALEEKKHNEDMASSKSKLQSQSTSVSKSAAEQLADAMQ